MTRCYISFQHSYLRMSSTTNYKQEFEFNRLEFKRTKFIDMSTGKTLRGVSIS